MKNKYWLRYCFENLGALDTDYLTLEKCYEKIRKDLRENPFIKYCYILTTDAWGECGYDLVRRNEETIYRGLEKGCVG